LDDEKDLENWFYENISTEKNQVFKKFEMTISVMQDTDAIYRVAYEAIEDLVLDGVLYGELRYAPLQHLKEKLSPQQVVDAVSQGVRDGEKDFGGEFHTILCAMRQHQNSTEVAKLAIDNFNNKVIGFDLAGPEYNFPPSLHKDACNLISESDIGLTIHAGEAADLSYIEDAVFNCQAQRIGHGWQIIEGCEFKDGQYIPNSKIAQHVLDYEIPLEICISSNVKSGASSVGIDNHPAIKLLKSGFKVTLNSDNRLMAKTKISEEFKKAENYLELDANLHSQLVKNAVDARFTNLK
jgi:adenosine deaminase